MTVDFSVCVRPERFQVCLQDRDEVMHGTFISSNQYHVGQHDGKRWSGKFKELTYISHKKDDGKSRVRTGSGNLGKSFRKISRRLKSWNFDAGPGKS